MTCYIITYDLTTPGRDYSILYNAIKAYWTRAKINESTWWIVAQGSAKEIREYLSLFIDNNDRLFVIKSWIEASRKNAMCGNEWLQKHLIS